MSDLIPVIDGHNDLLLRFAEAPARRAAMWAGTELEGHLDLPRMRAGGFAGGFFAIYLPSPEGHDNAAMDTPPFALPLPAPLDPAASVAPALGMAADLLWMERASQGGFRVVRSAAEARAAMAAGVVFGVMHMEGAEAIRDPDALHAWHAMGLRSVGPVWSRPTAFGHGVPFAFPADPDTGPGLTDAGVALVREADALRMIVDLSHLNANGVDDVARVTSGPLVATHSNVHALCPSSRNLTDRQLAMIAERGGLVGLNFAVSFLRPDGRKDEATGLDVMLRHLDALLARLGEGGVALGSDFDGATIPAAVGDVAGLPRLIDAMRAQYGEALTRSIAAGNWLDLMDRAWGP